MTAASASWQMMMSGIPNINRFCFVLWRNFFIEIYIPIEPPMSETKNSVGSEMRCLPFSAFLLSEKVIAKPIMFIIMKYAAANAAIGCCFKRSMDPPVRTCLHKHMRTSFRQILPQTALKILAGRKPACGFLPCLQQNYARKSAHISCEDRF